MVGLKKPSKRLPPQPAAKSEKGPERVSPRTQPAASAAKSGWFQSKRPVLRFVLIFGVLIVLFYGVFYWRNAEDTWIGRVFPWYLSRYAEAGGAVLNWLGQEVRVAGQTLHSATFSVRIVRGCDAMEATALFVAGVLAFPVSYRRKITGVVAGVLILAIINLARIITLFLIGLYFRKFFHMMHIDVWQALFILLTISLWFLWAWWATRETTAKTDEQPA